VIYFLDASALVKRYLDEPGSDAVRSLFRRRRLLAAASLKNQGFIESWHDRKILPGREWAGDIDENLEKADVILLLVTADFLASDYCFKNEAARALERHEAGAACVIPVLLKSVDWSGAPFAKLQALPKDAKPVSKWTRRSDAWTDVTMGIRRAVEELRARRPR
jgi:TIR domain